MYEERTLVNEITGRIHTFEESTFILTILLEDFLNPADKTAGTIK